MQFVASISSNQAYDNIRLGTMDNPQTEVSYIILDDVFLLLILIPSLV